MSRVTTKGNVNAKPTSMASNAKNVVKVFTTIPAVKNATVTQPVSLNLSKVAQTLPKEPFAFARNVSTAAFAMNANLSTGISNNGIPVAAMNVIVTLLG